MQIPSMPFKVLALAPFRLQERGPWFEEPIRIEKTNLDQVMSGLDLSLDISVPENLCRTGALTIHFKRMKDFHPDRIVENNPFLKNLLDVKRFVEGAPNRGLSEEEIYSRLKEWPGLPFEVKFETRKKKPAPSSPVDEILKMVSVAEEGPTPLEAQPFVIQIDSALQQILGHILIDEDFRNLESIWQGIRFLIMEGGVDGEIILEIVPVSLETIEETLDHLMAALVNDLPSLILIGLPLDNSPRSLELLEKIALFSETLLVPTLCWVTQKFLYLDQWGDLKKLPFLPHYLEEQAFAKWRRLKKGSSAKWMAITCNRFLVRYPYGPDNKTNWVLFNEPDPLWISPVWAIGSLIGQSLCKMGWPTRFTEWQEIKLEGLALHRIEGNKYIPTETNFSEERISQFIQGGIIPLVSPLNKDFAFIPKETTLAGSSLSYQLFFSRITRFLFWCKDHFEKDLETGLLEQKLKKAFSLFWEKSGGLLPKGLEISMSQPKPDQPAVVKIVIEPSRQILPSGEKLELEFNW